jgi:hypothetical protein
MTVKHTEAPRSEPAKAKRKTIDVTVLIAEAYLDQVVVVVRRCRHVGLRVKEILAEIGIVQGAINPARLEALAKVDGVAAVEEVRSYKLPPVDSDLQ